MIFWRRERITRANDDDYLDRTVIFECRWFSIRLHKFVASDDSTLHDHPFNFVSFILRGGYTEYVGHGWSRTWDGSWRFQGVKGTRYSPGSVLFRRGEHAHRVELAPGRPAWTLVFTGPRRREWGFFTRQGWICHDKYDSAVHG